MAIRLNKESLSGSIDSDDANASDINIIEIDDHEQKCTDGECRLEWDDD